MTRYADSLSEVYEHIYEINLEITDKVKKRDKSGEGTKNGIKRPLLWFRGHTFSFYNLDPNIFRKADYNYNQSLTYSNNHLREDYRFQSFMARNYDNIDYKMPQFVIEWQEVMQHFGAKTRLMDWSESLVVALEFALEPFINPVKDHEVSERRRKADPVIWILQPCELNEQVYKAFIREQELIYKALKQEKGFTGDDNSLRELAGIILNELDGKEKEGIYYNIRKDEERNMNGIIGLSALELMRGAYRGKELEALSGFEINPYFYLLLRYYSDGVPVELGKLPPLASIHPYHSQRIKLQKGVFTVFPYYIPDKMMKQVKEVDEEYPSFGMEYMEQCIPYLQKIRITDPQRVADELMMTGAKRANLYPEMQNVSSDMENAI